MKFICAVFVLVLSATSVCAEEISTAHRKALEHIAAHPEETGLDDPLTQLRKIGERGASPVSGVMVRFQQLQRGIPVIGSLIVYEVRSDDTVRLWTRDIERVETSVVPVIPRQRAMAAALADLRVPIPGTGVISNSAELAILPRRLSGRR